MLPVVLPLLAGALLLLLESAPVARCSAGCHRLSALATCALLVAGRAAAAQADGGEVQAYLVGNWPAPFGIALALDRLAALMVLLTAAAWPAPRCVYALGGDDRRAGCTSTRCSSSS